MSATSASEQSTANTTIRPPQSRRLRVVLSAALLLVAAAMMGITSLAVFTDSEDVTGNTFTTGTIDIATAPTNAAITMAQMAPGDEVTRPINVRNDGSLELRYSISSTTTEDLLAGNLVLSIRSGVTDCTNAGFTGSGTPLTTRPLGATTPGIPILGSVAQGNQSGDRVLAAGANEDLCFNVSLPLATTTGQGAITTAVFRFDAEQTRNNP